MVGQKFSFLAIFILSACAIAEKPAEIKVENFASGCFLFETGDVITKEPVQVKLNVTPNSTGDCPCKSALLKYSSIQKMEGAENQLLSGTFSPLGLTSVTLPLSVQSKLVFKEHPVLVDINCAEN